MTKFNHLTFLLAAALLTGAPAKSSRARSLADANVKVNTGASGSVSAGDLVNNSWQTYCKSGSEAMDLGNYSSAEKIFLDGLKNTSDSAGEAALRAGLGETYLNMANFNNAAKQLNKAYSLLGKKSNDPHMGQVLDDLAWLNQGLGKMDKAQDYCQQALELRKRVLPPDSSDLADSYEHLAQILEKQGLLDQAQEFCKQALKIRVATIGPRSILAANVYDMMGSIMQRRGMSNDAAMAFQSAQQIKEATNAIFQPYGPHRAEDTCAFRYLPGAPNCAQGYSDSLLSESIAANNVIIQASIMRRPSDFAKFNHVRIVIKNNSDASISILPTPGKFIVIDPKVTVYEPMDSAALASQIEKKGDSKAKWIRFWGNNATTTYNSVMMGNYPTYGYMPTTFGYAPMVTGQQSGMTVMNTSVPDYQQRAYAYAKAAKTQEQSASDATNIRDSALGPMTIAPHSQVEGSLNFSMADFNKALLRIPVGNSIFEFLFDRTGK